ncbi:hypothetical protein AMTRI_Chr10g232850 [Amborella trichopoda]
MKCQKCHSKAMQECGVHKIDGDNNQLTVIEEEIDSVRLTSSLRKIFGYADLVSVNPAEGKQEEKEQKEVKEAKEVKKMEWRWQPPLYQHHYIEPGLYQYYNEPIGPFCSIM